MTKGIDGINVRFFLNDPNTGHCEEVALCVFEDLEHKGVIQYERHTGFTNGVGQICLTVDIEDLEDWFVISDPDCEYICPDFQPED